MIDDSIKFVISDICDGFSVVEYKGEPIYVKHISPRDSGEFAKYYNKIVEKCYSYGIKKFDDRLQEVIKSGDWSNELEEEILGSKKYLDRLRDTKTKVIIESQKKEIEKEIQERRLAISLMERKRKVAMGLVAEDFAEREMESFYVFYLMFRDRDLRINIFDYDELCDIDQEIFYNYLEVLMSVFTKISNIEIKRAASSAYGRHLFSFAEKIVDFYGKPVCNLTMPQLELFREARNYISIFNQFDVPAEIENDPDMIDEWFISKRVSKVDENDHTSERIRKRVVAKDNTEKEEFVRIN